MRTSLTRYVRLCAEEPFRIFFPLGLTIGATGVLLWALFLAGVSRTYPATAHARLMIEGMMTCFIFGFLGTAGPRVMSVPHFSAAEVLRLLILIAASTVAHLLAAHAIGDMLFVGVLLLFGGSLAVRFRKRKDSPPPNFALVGLGIVNGIVGGALLAFCEATGAAPNFYRLGSSLLNVGFPLLPLLGVAPFFLRRLLDLPTDPAPNWAGQAALAVATGLVIDATLVLEIFGSIPHVAWLRCACAVIYIGVTMPRRGNSLLATSLRMSLAAVLAGLGLIAFLPAYRISGMHVLFIGGVTVAILSVATRVVLGHSGRIDVVRRRSGWLGAALVLFLLAMISRFSADFVATRNEHLIAAALCWLAGAVIWGAIVLPHVGQKEAE